MRKYIDLTGRTFGRLTVLRRGEDYVSPKGYHLRRWICRCFCGNQTLVQGCALTNGTTKSCGCLHIESARQAGRNMARENRYELREDCVVGYTANNEPFYFDQEFYNLVKSYSWYKVNNGYIATRDKNNNGKLVLLHRLITNADDGLVVDHINHKPEDNRLSNLRIVTQSQNMQNTRMRSDNKSGVTGVSLCTTSKRWHARIDIDGKGRFLGSYKTFDEAVAARKAAEEKYFGEYSYSNSISAVPKIEQSNPPVRVKSIFGGKNETCIDPRPFPKQPPVFASPRPAHLNGYPV